MNIQNEQDKTFIARLLENEREKAIRAKHRAAARVQSDLYPNYTERDYQKGVKKHEQAIKTTTRLLCELYGVEQQQAAE